VVVVGFVLVEEVVDAGLVVVLEVVAEVVEVGVLVAVLVGAVPDASP
jgi:hypothetical protein